jgi:hypothetical protein
LEARGRCSRPINVRNILVIPIKVIDDVLDLVILKHFQNFAIL